MERSPVPEVGEVTQELVGETETGEEGLSSTTGSHPW